MITLVALLDQGFLFTFGSVFVYIPPIRLVICTTHILAGARASPPPPSRCHPPLTTHRKPNKTLPPGMRLRAEHEMNGTKPRWGQLDMPPMCMPSTKSHFSGTLQWQLCVILPVILLIHHIHHMLACSPPLLLRFFSKFSNSAQVPPSKSRSFPSKRKAQKLVVNFSSGIMTAPTHHYYVVLSIKSSCSSSATHP